MPFPSARPPEQQARDQQKPPHDHADRPRRRQHRRRTASAAPRPRPTASRARRARTPTASPGPNGSRDRPSAADRRRRTDAGPQHQRRERPDEEPEHHRLPAEERPGHHHQVRVAQAERLLAEARLEQELDARMHDVPASGPDQPGHQAELPAPGGAHAGGGPTNGQRSAPVGIFAAHPAASHGMSGGIAPVAASVVGHGHGNSADADQPDHDAGVRDLRRDHRGARRRSPRPRSGSDSRQAWSGEVRPSACRRWHAEYGSQPRRVAHGRRNVGARSWRRSRRRNRPTNARPVPSSTHR